MSIPSSWIVPDWPAPESVRAISTTREGGVSAAPCDSFNVSTATGDSPAAVERNCADLKERAGLPGEPCWLTQVHGHHVVTANANSSDVEADASVTTEPGSVCVIKTADCLPVLLTDRAGSVIGAAHCGWRGLVGGVLENTIQAMKRPPGDLLAWLGPAIGPDAFEVGPEVRDQFVAALTESVDAFKLSSSGRWIADIYELARMRLRAAGVRDIHGGGWCTVSDPERFFSHRRDNGKTGRMATLIWINPRP